MEHNQGASPDGDRATDASHGASYTSPPSGSVSTCAALRALAERCEKATGPDRELDGLIEIARDPMRETILYNEPGRFPQKSVRGPIKDLQLSGRDLADYISAPPYTASLDAAITLVPEGWGVKLDTPAEKHSPVSDPPSAAMLHCLPKRAAAAGATPALVLCAAALKARAAIAMETHRAETPKSGSVAKP